jgi:phosphopantetheine adenylyltransferase
MKQKFRNLMRGSFAPFTKGHLNILEKAEEYLGKGMF